MNVIYLESKLKLRTMKKLLLTGALLLSVSTFAQFSEDFEGTSGTALPAGWTQNTAATDGGYLTGTDLSSQYFPIPAHTRYVGTNDDACDCDKANEELISPSFTVPANGVMSFEYVLPGGYNETAEVGISTDGGATNTQIMNLPITSGEWLNGSYDISAYAGQTVNIVWTYHDQGVWAYGLILDDIEVFSPAPVDMEMTSLDVVPTVVAGNVTIGGTVTSLSGNNITSIDIVWNDGGVPNSETFAVNLNYGDTYTFSHGTQLNAMAGSSYNLDVCVIATGDADPSNNCLQTTTSAVSALVNKVTVGEEKTGEWCQWCPRGSVALSEMDLSNPNDFIGIAVHNGDAMTVTSYDSNIGTYVPGGYPGAGVDRAVDGDPSAFASMHAARVSEIPPASVSVSGSVSGNTLTVVVTADFVGTLSGDYRLAAVVTEDNVQGNGQANAYSSNGPMQNANTGSMPNFDWAAAGTTVTPVFHDHVARALGSNQINGAAGSLPATVTDGDSESYTYTFTVPGTWKLADLHFVGMLVNGSTGEILNAGKGSLPAGIEAVAASDFDLTVAPNPTNGIANIKVDLKESADVQVVVLDIVGNVVFDSGSSNLAAGAFVSTVDLSGSADGVYFAKVIVNGSSETVKINLTK